MSNVDFIIKVGGAAITDKTKDTATLNNQVTEDVLNLLADLHSRGLKFAVVLGAGSYAHPIVTRWPVREGGMGVCLARQGVTELGHLITTKLLAKQVPAVLASPFAIGANHAGVPEPVVQWIAGLLDRGLVPVLHGDVIYDASEFSVLSGDVIVRHLAVSLHAKYAVFLSNMDGIYTKHPSLVDAKLIPEIVVNNGIFEMPDIQKDEYDGGLELKLSEAVKIVAQGIPVFFARAASAQALGVCLGNVHICQPQYFKKVACSLVNKQKVALTCTTPLATNGNFCRMRTSQILAIQKLFI